MNDLTRYARLIEQHADLLGARVEAAVAKLQEQTGGYSSRASGADSGGGGGDGTSPTERAAIAPQWDPAAADLAELRKVLPLIEGYMRNVLAICHRTDPNRRLKTADVDVAGRLAQANDMWCDHHLTFGRMVPRWKAYRTCDWCYTFKLTNAVLPPRALVDMHDRGLNVTQKDIAKALGKAVA